MNATQRLALATVGLTFVLVVIGVIVRASGSGLGCPDWPLCHGGAVPPAQHHALIEFSHRFTASIVGFMVIALAIMMYRNYRHVPALTWVAIITVPLVGFQGLLGAITVVRELPPEIVATHLITAMMVLSCQLFVTIGLFRYHQAEKGGVVPGRAMPAAKWAFASLGFLVIVMWVGAYMTESGAATACTSWPSCSGMNFLPGNDDHEITHMGHRYLAGLFLVFLGITIAMLKRTSRESWTRPVVIAGGVLYTTQVIVGALNVWYTFPEPLTILHTAIATAIWIVLSATAILCWYRPVASQRSALVKRAEVPA